MTVSIDCLVFVGFVLSDLRFVCFYHKLNALKYSHVPFQPDCNWEPPDALLPLMCLIPDWEVLEGGRGKVFLFPH